MGVVHTEPLHVEENREHTEPLAEGRLGDPGIGVKVGRIGSMWQGKKRIRSRERPYHRERKEWQTHTTFGERYWGILLWGKGRRRKYTEPLPWRERVK